MDLNTLLKENPDALNQLAIAMGASMVQAQNLYAGANRPVHGMDIFKETSLTLPTTNIYGRYSIFDPCAPGDIFGLQIAAHGLPQWLGARANNYYMRCVLFITWWGPEGTVGGTSTTGATAPCDDPPGWEYGNCGYNLLHTSWYSRAGDALSPHSVVQDRCETSPRYRLNGKLITDDVEWQMNGIMNVLLQSIRRDLIHGAHTNANEMDGLESLIKTGYTDDNGIACPGVDSILINWASDDLDGAVNAFGNFFDYLDEVVTEIEYRASALGSIAESDMALVTSRFMATALLDSYACYTTCGVTSTTDISDQALRAQQRALRRELNAGPLYDGASAVGYIHLKSGRRLPIIVEDAMDISKTGSNYQSDIYLLTRRVGGIDVLYGEYLNLGVAENRLRRHDPNVGMRADASGRFLMKGKEDNFCTQLILGTSPELYLSAPWAQARFSDVATNRKRVPLTGDPFQPQYLPGGAPLYTAQSQA
jgi:hypothetical protein